MYSFIHLLVIHELTSLLLQHPHSAPACLRACVRAARTLSLSHVHSFLSYLRLVPPPHPTRAHTHQKSAEITEALALSAMAANSGQVKIKAERREELEAMWTEEREKAVQRRLDELAAQVSQANVDPKTMAKRTQAAKRAKAPPKAKKERKRMSTEGLRKQRGERKEEKDEAEEGLEFVSFPLGSPLSYLLACFPQASIIPLYGGGWVCSAGSRVTSV